ncbi:FecCD family ABC transporter permease [Saccharothrix coeruleofusca]|uniref:Iron ABC transporter permease n=1 Tax=Saccharothrix coeruleofusca TaxID=33919 RepID=A0A918EAM3_9PSEU|nr:iron ABC transporter permease [Saccharothrix coeruleofusca]GGP35751.1 iron ABC transporter permease [Saccharothrix coeruleofusca]
MAVRTTRRPLGLLLIGSALLAAAVASVAIGAKEIPLDAIWHALVSPTGVGDDLVVRELRVPRTVIGVVVGVALGVGGALMQGHTRNPLADPGVLGVTQGAALAVVLAIFTLGVTSPLAYVWFAFAGALAASAVVFALGSAGRAGPTPVTLALAGAAVSALMQGLVSALVLLDRQSLDAFRFWQVGGLAGRELSVLWPVLPFLVAGLLLAAAGAPGMNALALGEEVARSLGHRVALTRALGIAAITLLVGGAVAVCGPIGFLGLVVPHVARAVTGPDYRWLLPCSGLLGAVVLLLADVLGRVVARPGELEVGIVMALVGAPFFIALVRRKKLVKL